MDKNSNIEWLKTSAANPYQSYESIDLLYDNTQPEILGRDIALTVSCSDVANNGTKGVDCIQKLEIVAVSSFSQAKLQVTHEVLPGQGPCSQIISVNPKLKIGGFDDGCVIAIKNFGVKKTFNCDVRARLTHHHSAVNVLAANHHGDQIASGSVLGELSLYKADVEEVSFISRTTVGRYVTGLAYLSEANQSYIGNDNGLIFSTLEGEVGIVDTRCKLAESINHNDMYTCQSNLTSLCIMSKLPGVVIYGGCASGEIISLDLRNTKEQLPCPPRSKNEGCIRRLKEVLINDTQGKTHNFLVYTNETDKLQIYDVETMKPDERWSCDRCPGEEQRDFVQVRDHIVSCGRRCSIGCWVWDNRT